MRRCCLGEFDIWGSQFDGEWTPFPIVTTASNEQGGQFSPDTRWIAYQSDESGQYEIYVQPFPGSGEHRADLE